MITAVFSGAVTSLAENAAAGEDRWPGPLDQVRRHAWGVLGVGLVMALLLALLALFQELKPPAAGEDPLPPAPPEIPRWVVDRAQARQVAVELSRRRGMQSVGITATAGLHGAGGFGKTTLTEMVWADRKVQAYFRGRIYRVTLGLEVRSRAEITAKVAEATRFITGDHEVFDDPDLAGAHLGRLLDARPRTLLLLDDVWSAEQLAPFLIGGASCRRLITTRLPELLPRGAYPVRVDEMSAAQARKVLAFGLTDSLPEDTVLGLLRVTGRWPLLLRICNQYVHRRVDTGLTAAAAAAEILRKLRDDGPAGLDPATPVDLNNPRARQTAVTAAVEAGAVLLPVGGFERFTELGIFAEDEPVPVNLVTVLWQATGSLGPDQSRDLCSVLGGLSLLELDSAHGGRIRLHDVIRDFMRSRLGSEGVQRVSGALVDAVAAVLPPADPQPGGGIGPIHAWWQHSDRYLADHLVAHYLDAGRAREAESLALDLRWIEHRLAERGATAPLADMSQLPSSLGQQAANDFSRSAHLLVPITPAHALGAVLRSRLAGYDAWRSQAEAWQSTHPALHNRWPVPDTPDPAQIHVLDGHIGPVRTVAISPDGTWLATGSDSDASVRIWDAATGRTAATLTGHTGSVVSVAISPDGTWFATGSSDGTVRIWDAATRRSTGILYNRNSVTAVAISPDGTWLATGSNDGTVRIRSLAGRNNADLTGTGINAEVVSVAISPDGTWLTASDGYTVRIWDVATRQTTATLTVHASPVNSVAISPDGTWFATGSNDGTVRIRNAATRHTTATLTGHTDSVIAVAISPDGTWLATGGLDGRVRIWDIVTGRTLSTVTDASNAGSVIAVAISPDGGWLATGGLDGRVRIWDIVTGRTLSTVTDASNAGSVTAVAFAPDGTWLATGSNDGRVRIWDAATGQTTATLTGHTSSVTAVAISPDGTWLATGSNDGTVRIWDAATGQTTATLTGHTSSVTAVAISPDGTWLATGSNDGRVRIWDAATGQTTATLTGHTSSVTAVAISPDGTWLATSDGYAVRIWDGATGRTTATLISSTGSYRPMTAVSISPDGTRLAVNDIYTVRIWDVVTGQTSTLTGHTGLVTTVAISPDGTRLATASDDRTVRIWDCLSGGLVTAMRTEGELRVLEWAPSGGGLAAAGHFGLYLYNYDPGTQPAN